MLYDGETYTVSGGLDKKGEQKSLKANTKIMLDEGENIWTEVHTSCSQPLYENMWIPVYKGKDKEPVGQAKVTHLIIILKE